MATVDFTGGSAVGTGMPYGVQAKIGIRRSRLDAAKTGITNTNADVYQMIDIKAGEAVLGCWAYVVTGDSTGTGKIQIGVTGGDTDLWVAETLVDTDATLLEEDGDSLLVGKTVFATAGTIDILVSTAALVDAVIDVYALVLDMNPNEELK